MSRLASVGLRQCGDVRPPERAQAAPHRHSPIEPHVLDELDAALDKGLAPLCVANVGKVGRVGPASDAQEDLEVAVLLLLQVDGLEAAVEVGALVVPAVALVVDLESAGSSWPAAGQVLARSHLRSSHPPSPCSSLRAQLAVARRPARRLPTPTPHPIPHARTRAQTYLDVGPLVGQVDLARVLVDVAERIVDVREVLVGDLLRGELAPVDAPGVS
jgi:hypothetical protein